MKAFILRLSDLLCNVELIIDDLSRRGFMNAPDYAQRSLKNSLNLSVNEDLVTSAKVKNINLSFFLESKLLELLNNGTKSCGGRDLNPRIPAEQDLKSCAFGQLGYPRF